MEQEHEILWGIPNLGTVERYRDLQDIYRLLPLGDPIICSPNEMATGLLIAKRVGKGLVLEDGRQLSVDSEAMPSSRDVVLTEGPCLASVVAVNYAYFRGVQLIDVGKVGVPRLAWFEQKCGEVDGLTSRIRSLREELIRRGKGKVVSLSVFASPSEPPNHTPEQESVTRLRDSQIQSLMRDLMKVQKNHIQDMREAVQQIVNSVDPRWANLTAFTEGIPYTLGVNLPCGLIPNPIAAHYIFDEVYGEIRRMSPTASLLVVDPGFFGPNSEVPLVVNQFLARRAACKTILEMKRPRISCTPT